MSSSRARGNWRLRRFTSSMELALALTVGACAACGRDEAIVVETLELAEGEFAGLAWGGTQVERFHVVARRGTGNEADDEVVLIAPHRAEPCSLGPLALYTPQQPRTGAKFVLGSPSPAKITVFDDVDEEGFGRLGFVDVDCKRAALELEDIRVRPPFNIYPPDFGAMQLAVLDRAQSLYLVDPWSEAVARVGEEVRDVVQVTDGAWLNERGQLVKRDFEGRELRRLGSDVSEFILLGVADDIAYIDAGKLVVRRAGKSEELAADACGVRKLDGFLSGSISYFAPCAPRQLTVSPLAGKPLTYAAPVDAYTAQLGRLVLVREGETATTISSVFAQDPQTVRMWATLPPGSVEDVWPVSASWVARLRVADGTRQLLRLGNETPSRAPITIVTGMRAFAAGQQRALAWLKDPGELTMADQNAAEVIFRARDVSWFRFVFDRRSPGLLYITKRDPENGAGRLNLRLWSGESFVLDDNVREPHEVWWPERGILYVRRGEDPGIRFARVDLPCTMTSDSPWACGF